MAQAELRTKILELLPGLRRIGEALWRGTTNPDRLSRALSPEPLIDDHVAAVSRVTTLCRAATNDAELLDALNAVQIRLEMIPTEKFLSRAESLYPEYDRVAAIDYRDTVRSLAELVPADELNLDRLTLDAMHARRWPEPIGQPEFKIARRDLSERLVGAAARCGDLGVTYSTEPHDVAQVVIRFLTTLGMSASEAGALPVSRAIERLAEITKTKNATGKSTPVWLDSQTVAALLGKNRRTIVDAARDKRINAFQSGKGAPWSIDAESAADLWKSEAGPLRDRIQSERRRAPD